jgi:hypothetical protein
VRGECGTIVVVGGYEDIWPVAGLLASQLPPHLTVHVIEQSASASSLALLPVDDRYFGALGWGVAELAAAGARFMLGFALDGLREDGIPIIAAPSGDLPAIAGLALHQILRRVAAQAGALDRLAELYHGFSFCARAAESGKMALPADGPDTPLAMLGPLALVDRGALAQALDMACTAPNVVRHKASEIALERGEGDIVDTIRLADGVPLEAGFVIDLRPLDPASARGDAIPLPLLETAQSGGIAFELRAGQPLPAYCVKLRGEADLSRPFALAAPWQGNHLRIGPGAARIGGLFSADSRLLLAHALDLVQCLPATRDMTVEARRFNALHARTIERLAELVAAPLALNTRSEQEWQAVRASPVPEALRLRIDQFRNRGRLPEFDGEIVDRQFWIDLLMASGVVPRSHDRRADAFDPRQLDRALGTVRAQLDQTLREMSSQAEFDARIARG